jgi:diaminopimelate decarboxylase
MIDEKLEQSEPLSPVVSEVEAKILAGNFGTPVFGYSQDILEEQANKALAFPNAYGITVRYAMKANSNSNILRIFDQVGLHIDASSGYEAERAIKAKILPGKISLTSQLIPGNGRKLIEQGVNYVACSLDQLMWYGKFFPNSDVSVRINPGKGSGGTKRTNTGGPSSSFGIWHEEIPEVLTILKKYGLNMTRYHSHIGSGSDPKVWKKVAFMNLENILKFIKAGHNINTANFGGGYKVGRMSYEKSTDLQECGEPIKQAFVDFAKQTGVELKLEIEPGTFLVANAGALVSRVVDVKSTPKYKFLITDAGMPEITRPALYGAQHPISIVQVFKSFKKECYIVSGKCCESGDILTPAKTNPEKLQPRLLPEAVVGDLVVIGGAGAYCSGMCTKNYNSYPEAAEVLIDKEDGIRLIRERQTLEQMTQNEIAVV